MNFNFKPQVLIVGSNANNYLALSKTLKKAGFAAVDFAPNLKLVAIALSEQSYQGLLLDASSQDLDFADILSNLAADGLLVRIGVLGNANDYQNLNLIKHAQSLGFELLEDLALNLSLSQAYNLRAVLDFPAHLAQQLFSVKHLKQALVSGKICSYFQPKLELKTGQIVAAEALVRWQIKDDVVLLPSSFLPSLMAQDLAQDLLLRSVDDALAAHNLWRGLGFKIKCAINLPPHLLLKQDLAAELQAKTLRANVEPHYLIFGVLENPAIQDAIIYKKTAYLLRSIGFGLAQDDHGRGFDSLYNLLQLPFTELKIDRNFVSGAWQDQKRAIAVKRISQLGQDLNLTITAEGVESAEDFAFMQTTNCNFMQGFFIAKAISAKQFGQLLINF